MIASTQEWLEIRQLRNKLVRQYMEDAEEFAQAIRLAREYSETLIDTRERFVQYGKKHFDREEN